MPRKLPRDYSQLRDDQLLQLIWSGHSVLSEPKRAENFLRSVGGLEGLRSLSPDDFEPLGMLGHREAEILSGAMELAWRLLQRPWAPTEPFRESRQVFNGYRNQLGREKVECVWLLFLDARLRNKGVLEISRGAVTGTIVHPREVLKPVLQRQVPAFIVIHNHPSGDPLPSREDCEITQQIARAAALLQVDFLDHIIITAGDFFQFCRSGIPLKSLLIDREAIVI